MKPERRLATALLIGIIFLTASCRGPSQANIELRKEKQKLEEELAQLRQQRDADAARIRALESQVGTLPTLPQDRLNKLFTTHGIRFGRLSGGAKIDPASAGDDAMKIYITPVDDKGDVLKAAGAFVVEAFDLTRGSDVRVGRWEFPVDDARKNWFGEAMLYTYVLTCPWQEIKPSGSELTVKVSFTDELTQRTFSKQKVIKVSAPSN